MSAQVIQLTGQNRAIAAETRESTNLASFEKALFAVKSLHGCSMTESRTAIENWQAADMLTRGERDALFLFFGWEK